DERPLPVAEDGQAQDYGTHRRHRRTEIGNEAEREGEEAPHHGVGQADEVQTETEGRPVSGIDDGLRHEVSADPGGSLVQRSRGSGEPAVADEPDETIPYLMLLDQHEDHEHEEESRAAEELEDLGELPDATVRLDHHGDGLALPLRHLPLLQLPQHLLGGGLHAGAPATSSRYPELGDFLHQVPAAARQPD